MAVSVEEFQEWTSKISRLSFLSLPFKLHSDSQYRRHNPFIPSTDLFLPLLAATVLRTNGPNDPHPNAAL
jgi:hypothetical protein